MEEFLFYVRLSLTQWATEERVSFGEKLLPSLGCMAMWRGRIPSRVNIWRRGRIGGDLIKCGESCYQVGILRVALSKGSNVRIYFSMI